MDLLYHFQWNVYAIKMSTFRIYTISSIIFRRFKSKGPEFKGQKLASEKSRGTVRL